MNGMCWIISVQDIILCIKKRNRFAVREDRVNKTEFYIGGRYCQISLDVDGSCSRQPLIFGCPDVKIEISS